MHAIIIPTGESYVFINTFLTMQLLVFFRGNNKSFFQQDDFIYPQKKKNKITFGSLQKWRFSYLRGQQHFLFQWTRDFFDETYALQTGLKVSSIWNFAQFFFVSKFTYRPNCYNLFSKHQEKYFTKQRAGSIFKVWSISQKRDCPIGILLPGHNNAAPFPVTTSLPKKAFCKKFTRSVFPFDFIWWAWPQVLRLDSKWELMPCWMASISIPAPRRLIHLWPSQCDRYIHPSKDNPQVGRAAKWMHQIAADTHNADFSLFL